MPTEVCRGKMRELNLSEGERCNQLISSCLITEGGDNLLLNFQPPVSSVELLSTYFLIWCPRSSEHSLIMQEDAAQTPQHVSATRSQTVKCDFIKKKKKRKKGGEKSKPSIVYITRVAQCSRACMTLPAALLKHQLLNARICVRHFFLSNWNNPPKPEIQLNLAESGMQKTATLQAVIAIIIAGMVLILILN